jgi:NAD(P)-dependent dehydrogenase (short-subunit alcohol dehydrogenase family)
VEESAAKLEASTGRRCLGAAADVRDPEQLKKAVQAAKEKYGKLDFVVCGGSPVESGTALFAADVVQELPGTCQSMFTLPIPFHSTPTPTPTPILLPLQNPSRAE